MADDNQDLAERAAAFETWRTALNSLTLDREEARRWRRTRYDFAHRLGTALTSAQSDVPPVTGPVLYGIWLQWGLLYIGQTQAAQRRLRDLPVGESHHLATTFPAEIWHRVVVVPWAALPEAEGLPPDLPPAVVGLALEHRLQSLARPLFNEERRRADGGWREVTWGRSSSRGAQTAPLVDNLFGAVTTAWKQGATASRSIVLPTLRVVLPQEILAPERRLPSPF